MATGQRLLRSVPLNRWTLQRFGLTPEKLRDRVANLGEAKVFCVCIPKAGTHLLERTLCLHPRLYRKLVPTLFDANIGRWGGLDGVLAGLRPGQVIVSHLPFRSEYPEVLARRGVGGIFLVRDPRDVVISETHYIVGRPDHQFHAAFTREDDLRRRLRLAIAGDPELGVPSIAERLDEFAGWLDTGCLVVRFEDLIGPDGGGDRTQQETTVRAIYRHLGLAEDDDVTRSVCDRLFSAASPTFRRGTMGEWRLSFDRELHLLFEEVAGSRMAIYGYAQAPVRGPEA
jgi:hypothetical protein